MKVFVIATRADRHAEEFAPHLEPEAQMAVDMFLEQFIREIYSREDGRGAVLVCEADSEDEVKSRLSELPLVQHGLIELQIFPVKPYRGFEKLKS